MLTPERHQIILDLLQSNHTIKIHEIAKATNASESTIRRDLSQLEQEDKLRRVHGGASHLHQKSKELSIREKSTKNLHEKQKIAEYATSFIREGDCIFLDAGTTTYEIIPFLKDKEIIVVTNGLNHLDSLIEQGITTYVTGGYVKPKTRALIGQSARVSLEAYRFDKCFLGANGIHHEFGYTTPDPEEVTIKQTALHHSQQAYILADHSKINNVTFSKIASVEEATIVTNESDSFTLESFRSKTTVKVVTP